MKKVLEAAALPWPDEGLYDRIMGSGGAIFGDVVWQTDSKLRSAVGKAADHFVADLRKLTRLRGASATIIRRQVFHLLGSFDARVCSLILAWPSWKAAIPVEAAFKMAASINPRHPAGEAVKTWMQPKPEGGSRQLWSFGPRARTAQKLAVQILMALWGPARFEFAQRRRGRDRALEAVVFNAEKKGGARWFLTADIKDCFGSFDREALIKIIPLPRSVIENSLFVMEGTEITYGDGCLPTTSKIAVPPGLPQGSLASPYIASKLIEPMLEKLSGDVVLSHCDDILVGCRTKKEAMSNVPLLGELMSAHPAGPLLMKYSVAPLGKPIDFCSYRLRRRWKMYGGGVRLTPSPKAYSRFEARALDRLQTLPPASRYLQARKYRHSWMSSHRLWDRSEAGDAFVDATMAHVLSQIFWAKVKEKSSLHGP